MIDQLGREINLSQKPRRIVSLVPSQTELLAHLSLENEVVGITKFCIYPDRWLKSKKRIGGTKQLDLEAIYNLEPDLIIGNKEENVQGQVEQLTRRFPVWMSDVNSLGDALDMIRKVSELTGKAIEGEQIASNIELRFSELQEFVLQIPIRSVAYFIWKNPWMVAANHTFIDDILHRCGLVNCFKPRDRYPEINPHKLKEINPDFLMLSSEPFPFTKQDGEFLKSNSPESHPVLVNGEYFSWYGPRLAEAVDYFMKIRLQMEKYFVD